jgi:glycosyltransferase involved in cell wall biosynthesis
MGKKVKILEAIRQGKIGGGESHVLNLVKNMDRKRFEPIVLSFTAGPMVDELILSGIQVKVIETERPFDVAVWKKVKTFMVEEGIDIIHAHGTRAMSNVFFPARQLHLPLIYTVHGWSFHPDQIYPVRQSRQIAERILTKRADQTICVSRNNQIEGVVKLNLKNSLVIHNAIDLHKFNPAITNDNLRKELHINKNHTVIGYIVRMTSQKDPFTMLKAFQSVLKEHQDVTLLMVGDGELKEKSMRFARELNIQQHVIFEPFRTDIPEVLQTIDIYCLPSLWEGYPIGILEAMAMKKCVVASPVGGTKELVMDGSTGLLVEPHEPEKLAEALRLLIENINLRSDLATNGHSFAQNNFSIQTLVQKVEKEYTKLVNNNTDMKWQQQMQFR